MIGEKPVSFAGANAATCSTQTEMNMRSGTYPVNTNEALLNQAALEQLGLSVGDTVAVTVPDDSQKEYLITGVLENMGSLLKADVYGMVLSEDGFREIADEAAKDGTVFRIQFKGGVRQMLCLRSRRKRSTRRTAETVPLLLPAMAMRNPLPRASANPAVRSPADRMATRAAA